MLSSVRPWIYHLLFRPRCWGCGLRLRGVLDFCFGCRRLLLTPSVSAHHLLRFRGPVKPLLQVLRGEAYFLGARWCETLLDRQGVLEAWRKEKIGLVTLAPRARPRREDGLPLLAERVARALGARFEETLRKGADRSQHGRDRGERMDVPAFIRPRKGLGSLEGMNVLLLDDVNTTGTTLELGAYCLRQAGAARVITYSVARQMVEGFERKREEPEQESEEVKPLLLHLFV